MSLFLMIGLNLFDIPWLPVLGKLLGFSGCLLLDPLRFISFHLLVNVW